MLPLRFRAGTASRLRWPLALTPPPAIPETTGARMEHTNTQSRAQTDVQDSFRLEAVRDDAGRNALFARMCREGLTGCAMYAWAHPREDD